MVSKFFYFFFFAFLENKKIIHTFIAELFYSVAGFFSIDDIILFFVFLK